VTVRDNRKLVKKIRCDTLHLSGLSGFTFLWGAENIRAKLITANLALGKSFDLQATTGRHLLPKPLVSGLLGDSAGNCKLAKAT